MNEELTQVSIETQWSLMWSIGGGVMGVFLIICLIIGLPAYRKGKKARIKEAEFQKNYRIKDAKRHDEYLKLTTCPKCKEYGSHGLDHESKKYDQETDIVTIWRTCESCGYKQYENQPTVNDFIDILDNQFKKWNNNGDIK